MIPELINSHILNHFHFEKVYEIERKMYSEYIYTIYNNIRHGESKLSPNSDTNFQKYITTFDRGLHTWSMFEYDDGEVWIVKNFNIIKLMDNITDG